MGEAPLIGIIIAVVLWQIAVSRAASTLARLRVEKDRLLVADLFALVLELTGYDLRDLLIGVTIESASVGVGHCGQVPGAAAAPGTARVAIARAAAVAAVAVRRRTDRSCRFMREFLLVLRTKRAMGGSRTGRRVSRARPRASA